MKHPIPDTALDDRLSFVGTAGSGKTYNAGSGVERLLSSGARVVIPDPLGVWWGLALCADGETPSVFRNKGKLVIFGGPRGDLPLTEHAGALIGETAATMAESCILDLSEIGTRAGERRFMLAFLTALYRHKPKAPLHVIFDEADMWAPQKIMDRDGDAARLYGMMETIVRRGRIKGFIPWLITQRPAVLAKDVLSQIDGLISFKLTSSQDRDAIGNWVEGQADKKQWQEIWGRLPAMERGIGLVWLPARGVLQTAAFPQKATFDSSRTPERGERALRAGSLKPVNLDKLKDRLLKVEVEAKANDPRELKAQIAKLTAELAKKSTAAPVVDKVALRAAENAAYQRGEQETAPIWFRRGVEAASEHFASLAKGFNTHEFVMKQLETWKAVGAIRPASPAPAPTVPPRTPSRATRADRVADLADAVTGALDDFVRNPPAPAPRRSASHAGASNGDPAPLPRAERKVMTALAQYPEGRTKAQVAVLTGYAVNGGGFNNALSRLRTLELMTGRGDDLAASDNLFG